MTVTEKVRAEVAAAWNRGRLRAAACGPGASPVKSRIMGESRVQGGNAWGVLRSAGVLYRVREMVG